MGWGPWAGDLLTGKVKVVAFSVAFSVALSHSMTSTPTPSCDVLVIAASNGQNLLLAERFAAAARELFVDGPARTACIDGLARVRGRLGGPGATERTVALIESFLHAAALPA